MLDGRLFGGAEAGIQFDGIEAVTIGETEPASSNPATDEVEEMLWR